MKSVLRILEGFPSSPVVKNPPCNAGDTSLIHDPGSYYMKQGNWACALEPERKQQEKHSKRRAQDEHKRNHGSEKPTHHN